MGVGKAATPTPLGYFKVTDKAAWAGGFGTRWMGLDAPWGEYGIHGTNKPWTVGQRKSGGCIRMPTATWRNLCCGKVEVGMPVIITAGHFGGARIRSPADRARRQGQLCLRDPAETGELGTSMQV